MHFFILCGKNAGSISVGHRIKVKLPDDEYAPKEGLFLTLVSSKDAKLLLGNHGFDGNKNIVLSVSTPLGEAILGATFGQIVQYDVGGKLLRAQIIDIEVSPLFSEA
jgi:transcription elongation GreA/GreB family factor